MRTDYNNVTSTTITILTFFNRSSNEETGAAGAGSCLHGGVQLGIEGVQLGIEKHESRADNSKPIVIQSKSHIFEDYEGRNTFLKEEVEKPFIASCAISW